MKRLALLVITSCWTGPVVEPLPVTTPAPEKPDHFDLEITLQRTPCFGACPIFELGVHPDGTLRWYGRENVAVRGEKRRHLTRTQMKMLQRIVIEAEFFDLGDDGSPVPTNDCTKTPNGITCSFGATVCSDTSHSIVTVRTSQRSKTIDDAHCTDGSPVLTLEQTLEDLAAPWIGR
ncbi:MAG TPA: DUF6438 domain-containing protein [Kofleriaceae bacterium]